jgi:hypothetical protein
MKTDHFMVQSQHSSVEEKHPEPEMDHLQTAPEDF